MTLYEAARKYGVETHRMLEPEFKTYDPRPRPDLEIAHDLLAKLKFGDYRLTFTPELGWFHSGTPGHVPFIEAVIALCERAP